MMPSIKTVLSFLQMPGSSLSPPLPPPPLQEKLWKHGLNVACGVGTGMCGCKKRHKCKYVPRLLSRTVGLHAHRLIDFQSSLLHLLTYFAASELRYFFILFGASFNGDDTGSSYASPYRSWLSATSLAASVKVNSIVRPALNPALSAHVSINMLEVKCSNQLHAIGQGKL